MIRKSGYRFSLATNAKRLRGDHAQTKKIERDDDSKKSHPALGSSLRAAITTPFFPHVAAWIASLTLAMTSDRNNPALSKPTPADGRGGRNVSGALRGESAPWAPSTETCSLRPSARASQPPWPPHRDGPGYHPAGSARASGNCARNRASP